MTRVHADIDSIKELRSALRVFAGRQSDALDAAEAEIDRTESLLEAAAQEARYAIARRQAALEACYQEAAEAAFYGGWVDCSPLAHALAEAEERLARVREWQRRVQRAASGYRSAARRLEGTLSDDLPGATSFLANRIVALEAYHAAQVMAGVMALATSGATDLVGAAIGAMRSVRGEMSRILGSVGEQTAAQVLTEEFAFQELPFDQPKHGFDGVFRAPGIPLIVLEAKVNSSSALQLGQTEDGRQGSPEWVAAQAEKMVDRASAQWSPANERIGRLVQELGPENVPVVSVVMNPTTNRGDVYVRDRSGNWLLLHEDLVLEASTGGSAASAPAD